MTELLLIETETMGSEAGVGLATSSVSLVSTLNSHETSRFYKVNN